MRVLRLHGPKDLRMHEEPIPEPGRGEVRLKITSVGVCASDLHYYRDGRIGTTLIAEPLVIGHEAAAVVDAIGEGVTSHKIGDRVALEPTNACGECMFCKAGHFNVCPNVEFFGTPPQDGCFREYITWPAELAIKVPDSMTDDEAAIIEPLAVGVHAVRLADLKGGETVAVLGAGAIGLSVIQAAKVGGAKRIIVSEPVAARRELALKLGATEAIDPSTSSDIEEFKKLTDGIGPDVVYECIGEDGASYLASQIVRVLGKIVVVGIPDEDVYTFHASPSRRKEMTVIFCRRSNDAAETSIEWVTSGKADAKSMATHRFPLEDAAKAMEFAMAKKDGVIRAIIAVS